MENSWKLIITPDNWIERRGTLLYIIFPHRVICVQGLQLVWSPIVLANQSLNGGYRSEAETLKLLFCLKYYRVMCLRSEKANKEMMILDS